MKIIVPFDPESAARRLMEGRIVDEDILLPDKAEEVYNDDDHY